MIRATTPTHIFTFPDNPNTYDAILITYKQNEIVLEKEKPDLTIDGNTASVMLTQEETKLFTPDALVKVQVRVAYNGGEAFASPVTVLRVEDVLNDEVLP